MIVIQDLTLHRGEKVLLSGLYAEFLAGQVVVVLGPNGAGKSTLLQSMLGMFTPAAGRISIDGKAVAECSRQDLAEKITWQGDLPPSEFGLTVSQRLELSANGPDEAANQQAMTLMDLAKLKHRALGALSSGERQRVEIAATMVRDNPIWLMDEPTAHLDLRHQVDCLQLMKNEAKAGRLIITVLHDLQQAAAVADTVVLLDGKGGVEVGAASALLTPEHLMPVFGVPIQGEGKLLMPIYNEDKQ